MATLQLRAEGLLYKKLEAVMKKLLWMVGTALLILTLCSVSYAASDKCRVVEAENNQLILECAKKTGDFQVNDKIKIKSVKRKSVEGS